MEHTTLQVDTALEIGVLKPTLTYPYFPTLIVEPMQTSDRMPTDTDTWAIPHSFSGLYANRTSLHSGAYSLLCEVTIPPNEKAFIRPGVLTLFGAQARWSLTILGYASKHFNCSGNEMKNGGNLVFNAV